MNNLRIQFKILKKDSKHSDDKHKNKKPQHTLNKNTKKNKELRNSSWNIRTMLKPENSKSTKQM